MPIITPTVGTGEEDVEVQAQTMHPTEKDDVKKEIDHSGKERESIEMTEVTTKESST